MTEGRETPSAPRGVSGRVQTGARSIPEKARGVARNLRRRPGDYIFLSIVAAAALFVVVVIGALVVILVKGSWFTLNLYGLPFLWGPIWQPANYAGTYGALPFIVGTVYSSAIALLIAVPVALGIAIFLSELAPSWIRTPLTTVVELLAAVPSVVFGFWGLYVLVPYMAGTVEPWLATVTDSNPLIVQKPYDGLGILSSGIILAIMIIPTIAALSREALLAVPQSQREAALGLGATRWETTRMGVLKYARSGIVGAIVLGLGRAVGETMAVTMTVGNDDTLPRCLTCSGQSMASLLASEFLDPANQTWDKSSLIEIGLLLLVITLLINVVARVLIARLVTTVDDSDRSETGVMARVRRLLHLRSRPRRVLVGDQAVDTFVGRQEGALPGASIAVVGGRASGKLLPVPPLRFSPRRDAVRKWMNRSMGLVMLACVVIALVPLGSILYTTWEFGHPVLSIAFLTGPEYPAPCQLGSTGCQVGGIGPAIQGTFILMAMSAAWAIPVSLLAAIYLSEYGRGKVGRSLSFALDVMSGVPSIVTGLFVFTLFVFYDPSFIQSTYSQSLALGVIMLPIVTRTAEESLKLVPQSLREAAWALGVPQHKTATRVVLRTGFGPVLTGSLLAVARAGGETAPLLFLGFGRLSIFTNCTGGTVSCFNHFAGPLGPYIYNYALSPGSNNIAAAWGASLVFIIIMLGLSLGARLALQGKLVPAVLGG